MLKLSVVEGRSNSLSVSIAENDSKRNCKVLPAGGLIQCTQHTFQVAAQNEKIQLRTCSLFKVSHVTKMKLEKSSQH